MRTSLMVVCVAGLLAGCQSIEEAPAAPPMAADLAITGAVLVNAEAGTLVPEQTVLISDGHIAAVFDDDARAFTAPQTLAAEGRYLMPGLIDMHVHIDAAGLAAFPLNGVTTVRDMGTQTGPLAADRAILGARQAVAEGRLVGPEIVTAALVLDGPVERNPRWAPHFRQLENAAAVRSEIAALAAAGADFIKIYDSLDREQFAAAATAAASHDLPFAGHVPNAVAVLDAASAGMHTMEHLRNLDVATSRDEARWRAALVAATAAEGHPYAATRLRRASMGQIMASHDAAKATALHAALAEAGTGITPTLVVLWDPRWDDPDAKPDAARVADFSPIYRQILGAAGEIDNGYGSLEAARAAFAFHQRQVAELHAAGVAILVGTDAANPWVLPGYAIHEELALLVAAGLSPAEALTAATVTNARYLDAEGRLGRIAHGHEADLVLLDANPLADIAATRQIERVILDGTVYAPDALATMLRDAVAD